jgi:hypothetical protein
MGQNARAGADPPPTGPEAAAWRRAHGADDIVGGRRWKMTAEQFAGFQAFIAGAIAARDGH